MSRPDFIEPLRLSRHLHELMELLAQAFPELGRASDSALFIHKELLLALPTLQLAPEGSPADLQCPTCKSFFRRFMDPLCDAGANCPLCSGANSSDAFKGQG